MSGQQYYPYKVSSEFTTGSLKLAAPPYLPICSYNIMVIVSHGVMSSFRGKVNVGNNKGYLAWRAIETSYVTVLRGGCLIRLL